MKHAMDHPITPAFLLRFTLPSIVMMIVLSMYTVVDGTLVSHLVGTEAFSAINVVYPILGVVVALGTMFGTGTTAIVSRKLGQGDQKGANEIFSFVLSVTIVIGIAFAALVLIFLRPIIRMLGANDVLFPYCYGYAFPVVCFLPMSMLQIQFQTLIVAAGKPQLGLILTVGSGIVNVVLDLVFMGVFGWGISGAAIATGIGFCIPAIFGLCYFRFYAKAAFRLVRPTRNWKQLAHAAANGSSEMVSYLSESVTTFLFNITMMRLLGQDGVAAVAIVLYLDFVLVAVSLGYAMGVAPLISYNYGKGDKANIRKIFRLSVLLCLCVGICMTLGTRLFGGTLATVFTPAGSAVYVLAVEGLRCYGLSYLCKGCNLFASALFTAFGNGRVSAFLSFLRTLFFLSGSIILMAALFGVTGVWFAAPIAEGLALCVSIFCVWRYRRIYPYGG